MNEQDIRRAFAIKRVLGKATNMGTIVHSSIIAAGCSDEWEAEVSAFLARHENVESIAVHRGMNAYLFVSILPSGSKLGWAPNNDHVSLMAELKEIANKESTAEWVAVEFGADKMGGPSVVDHGD